MNETTNTPCILSIQGTIKSLERIQNVLNRNNYFDYIKQLFDMLYEELKKRKFKFLISYENMCKSLITVYCDNSNNLIAYCRKKGVVIYPGKNSLDNKVFQVSLYGNDATIENINKFITIIDDFFSLNALIIKHHTTVQ